MAYWRRSPRQMQAATDSVAVAPASALPATAAPKPARPLKSPRTGMMRQYDLVDRVRSYNPDTNEDLLNRAYVYAMKAHGAQTRASGDPYFSHPLEVAAILTDLKRMRKIWIPGSAGLRAVRLHGVDIGAVQHVFVGVGVIGPDALDQIVLPHHARARPGWLRLQARRSR